MLHSTTECQSLDSLHFMHPLTDTKDLEHKGTRIITRAEGVYLWDSEGNQIIDVKNLIINDPKDLESYLNNIPGVVENGIFSFNKPDLVLTEI